MASILRRRIPWGAQATAEESIPLTETSAFTEFETIEAASTALGVETGGIGFAVAGLTFLGFSAWEIYSHLKSNPKVSFGAVQRHAKNAHKNKEQVEQSIKEKLQVNVVNLEDQHVDGDFVPLENQHSGLVPPPFKYLGPGNSLNRGVAYNLADENARVHDEAYDKAETKEDVYKADREFLSQSGNLFVEGLSGQASIGDTIGAAVGAVGIGVKHLVESGINTNLYPSLPGKLKWESRETQKLTKLQIQQLKSLEWKVNNLYTT